MAKVSAYLVPFSHLDLFWLGAYEECLSRGNRVIAEVLEMCAAHPEFRFLLEDVVFIEHFLRCHPEKKQELASRLKNGQIEAGPKWAGIDQTPQLGEDLVRNSLYSIDYLERELGYTPQVMHTGDLPGWTPNYPQILEKLGIPYAVYTRTGPTDASLFYWVGLDGTRKLVWYSLKGYGWAHRVGFEISADKAIENGLETTMREVLAQGVEPIFVHWGTDLLLPGKKLAENLRDWNAKSDLKMAFATPTEYFEAAPREGLRELSGEIPSAWPYSDPQYTYHMVLTFPAVSALLNAERFSELARCRGIMDGYPADKIRESWLQVLETMDHNNNGQGNDQTNERKRSYYEMAIRTADRIREDALRRMAENVANPFGRDAYPIVVFNPMSWPRTELASTHVTYHGDIKPTNIAAYRQVTLVDEHGTAVPFQTYDTREGVAREETIRFVAEAVPAGGYRTYYLRPSDKPVEHGPAFQWDGAALTTPLYKLVVDPVTGSLSVTDLKSGQPLVSGLCVVAVEEKLDQGSFRDETTGRRLESVLESVELVESGAVAARLDLRVRVAESVVTEHIIVQSRNPKVEISVDVDFRKWRPMRLCLEMSTGIADPRINYGVPYGVSWTENIMANSAPFRHDEIPVESWNRLRTAIHWIDLSDGSRGVTVGSKHRCFRFEGPILQAVMLRAVVSGQCCYIRDGKRERHLRPYPGRYSFDYCLLPHTGGWQQSKSYRAGWELSYPLLPVVVSDSASAKRLPSSEQLLTLECDTDSVLLDVVKKAERGEETVVRFHETEGRAGSARLSLPGKAIKALAVADLREREIRKLRPADRIPYKAYEIVTLRVGW